MTPEETFSDLLGQYQKALVRIAVFAPYKGQEKDEPLQLICATVTLLPTDRMTPERPAEPAKLRLGGRQGTVFFDYLIMATKDAVDWYRGTPNTLKTPVPAHGRRNHSDGIALQGAKWVDLPDWPTIGVPFNHNSLLASADADVAIPFNHGQPARYHRRLTTDEDWSTITAGSLAHTLSKSDEALRFLYERIHIDFGDYPEYFGSLNLVVPDAQVGSVRQYIAQDNNDDETLVVQVVPRPGRDLSGLSVISMSLQSDVLVDFDKYPVPHSGLVTIGHRGAVGSSGLVLLHDEYGVITHQPVTPFLRRVSSRMSAMGATRKMIVPISEKKNAPTMTYTSVQASDHMESLIGDGLPEVVEKASAAAYARRLRKSAKMYEQTWFTADQRRQALKLIQSKIRNARDHVVIVDPYFGALQVAQLLYATQRKACSIRILTSSDAFQKQGSVMALQARLAKFAADYAVNMPEVRVATDKRTRFHDRFLIVDSSVWLLGSSLNTLGDRPTMVLRVPNPALVVEDVQALMAQAQPFDEYQFLAGTGHD